MAKSSQCLLDKNLLVSCTYDKIDMLSLCLVGLPYTAVQLTEHQISLKFHYYNLWWTCYEMSFVEYQVRKYSKNYGSSQLYSDSAHYKLKLWY